MWCFQQLQFNLIQGIKGIMWNQICSERRKNSCYFHGDFFYLIRVEKWVEIKIGGYSTPNKLIWQLDRFLAGTEVSSSIWWKNQSLARKTAIMANLIWMPAQDAGRKISIVWDIHLTDFCYSELLARSLIKFFEVWNSKRSEDRILRTFICTLWLVVIVSSDS